MVLHRTVSVLGLCVFGASAASPQGLAIDHKQVGCILLGKYPKMDACFSPAASLARGRVYFRPEGLPAWYYVEMKADQPCFTGVLPRPGKSLVGKKVEYYVEGQDRQFNATRTAEYVPVVVRSAVECQKQVPVAPFLSTAKVAVFPSVPAGFTVGGALGPAAVLAIVGAGAAAAGTAVAVASGNNDTTTAPTTQRTSVPPAVPSPTVTVPPTNPPLPSNRPPEVSCRTNPSPAEGFSPLRVTFNCCDTRDADGDVLTYGFDFGDGSGASSTSCGPRDHTYAQGNYRATTCLKDGIPGHEGCLSLDIPAGGPRPSAPPSPAYIIGWLERVTVQSDLGAPGVTLQMVVNSESAVLAPPGHAEVLVPLRPFNRIEGIVVQGSGRPGLWRLTIEAEAATTFPGAARPLQVITGDVVSLTPTSAVFRIRGESGERVVLAFAGRR